MLKYTVTITESLVCDVDIEATTAEEAESKAEENWNADVYADVKQFCAGISCSVRDSNCEERSKFWTVSIKDREDPDMDIWTASFSTEEKADAFKAAAEEKLRAYGVFETVDVTKDCSTLDDDIYLGWIDDRYGDPPDHVSDHL